MAAQHHVPAHRACLLDGAQALRNIGQRPNGQHARETWEPPKLQYLGKDAEKSLHPNGTGVTNYCFCILPTPTHPQWCPRGTPRADHRCRQTAQVGVIAVKGVPNTIRRHSLTDIAATQLTDYRPLTRKYNDLQQGGEALSFHKPSCMPV